MVWSESLKNISEASPVELALARKKNLTWLLNQMKTSDPLSVPEGTLELNEEVRTQALYLNDSRYTITESLKPLGISS